MTLIFSFGKVGRSTVKDYMMQIEQEVNEASLGTADVEVIINTYPVGSLKTGRKKI